MLLKLRRDYKEQQGAKYSQRLSTISFSGTARRRLPYSAS
jgi:hypothetical protein